MRDIDKGLLLAEYFSVDTNNSVSTFIDWVKNTETYSSFIEKKNELMITSYKKGKQLLEYAKTIHIEKSKTIEEAFIAYGKICFLLKISDIKYYSNPLLIQYSGMKKMTLGELMIRFDNQIMSLNDFSKLEGYSFEAKEEVIKKYINEWMKEADFFIIDPIRETKTNTYYFPHYRGFNFRRTIQLIALSAILLFLFFVGLTSNPSLSGIPNNAYGRTVGMGYHFLISFTSIYLIEIIVLLVVKSRQYKEYNKQYRKVYVNIDNFSLKIKEELYQYLVKQMVNHQTYDYPIDYFNKLTSLLEPAEYFSKRFEQKKVVKNDRITIWEKISIVIYTCLVMAFAILLYLGKNGRIG